MVDIPGDATTPETIAVGGTFAGEIEIAGDKDWIAVTLLAGQSYTISLSSPLESGIRDAFLSIFDAGGNLVASDDDSGQRLDSQASFTPTETGTFYIEASALSDGTGSYEVAVKESDPPNFLDSLDWGKKLPAATVNVYFATAGEVFDGKTSMGWNDYEKQQAMLAFQQFSNVCNLSFNVVTDQSQATLTLVTKEKAPWLGYFNPPGTNNEGIGVFNQGGDGWDQDLPGTGGLEQGGYGFITLIHEFGHAMGMAHPHDAGGTSNVWEGVTDAFDSYGTFDLNQGIYTVMSYNDGWNLHPSGENGANEYGWEGTLMAFDVAMMQQLYGANTSFNAGDTVYHLPDENQSGTYFSCIWDGGGTDGITYSGGRDVVIDLRAAHLGYAPGSGGFVSFAADIYGGFTIANGVVIEWASSGDGRDVLTGNEAKNDLASGAGGDQVFGKDGDDVLAGGRGKDTICGGLGVDRMWGNAGADQFVYLDQADSGSGRGQADRILGFVNGEDLIDLGALDAVVATDADDAFTWIGDAAFGGNAGELRWRGLEGGILIQADRDGDGASDFTLMLIGPTTIAASDFVL